MGKGVTKAVKNVNTSIAQELLGVSVFEQNMIDQTMIELYGTANKSKLGANAIVGMRFITASIMGGAAELLAYGTAVIVE